MGGCSADETLSTVRCRLLASIPMSGEFMWWLKTPIGIDVLSKATATVRSHGKIFWPGIRDVSDFKLWQLLLQSSPSSPFPPPWYFLKNTTVGPGITLAACLGGKPCCLMCPWWQRVMYYGILYHHDMLLPAIQTCARTTGASSPSLSWHGMQVECTEIVFCASGGGHHL